MDAGKGGSKYMSKLNIISKNVYSDLKHLNEEGDFLVDYLKMNDTRSNSSSEAEKEELPEGAD